MFQYRFKQYISVVFAAQTNIFYFFLITSRLWFGLNLKTGIFFFKVPVCFLFFWVHLSGSKKNSCLPFANRRKMNDNFVAPKLFHFWLGVGWVEQVFVLYQSITLFFFLLDNIVLCNVVSTVTVAIVLKL